MTAPLRPAHPQSELSRRGVLRGAAVAGVAAAVPLQFIVPPSAEVAVAAYRPRVRHYTRTALPTAQSLHMTNRFSYGYTLAL